MRVPGVTLRAYGVSAASASQRVGHLAASGETPEQAVTRVLQARTVLRARQGHPRAESGASGAPAAPRRHVARAGPHADA